jgi:hypothetical protein
LPLLPLSVVQKFSVGCSHALHTQPITALIWYGIFINCSWVVTQWQYTFTHKQYIEQCK